MAEKFKMPELTKEQIQILSGIVLLSGFFIFGYFKYFWSPISIRISGAGKKLESVERDIQSAEAQEKRLEKLRKEVAELKLQREAAERRLPRTRNVPDLLYTLTDMARKYGVEIHSLVPKSVTKKQYFTEVSYAISAGGTYHSLGKFMTALGLSERIFSTQGLQMSAAPGADSTVSASFVVIAYMYNT
ncbi:MAG: type 4a pilus biogenesis protein PilO [bacterium]